MNSARSPRPVVLFIAVLAAASAGIYLARRASLASPAQLAQAVRIALRPEHPSEARRLAQEAVALYPRSVAVRLAAAEVEVASNRPDDALAHLEQIHDDGSPAALAAMRLAGDALFQLGRLSEADQRFRRVLAREPHDHHARQQLATLLAISGRPGAARQFFFEIVKDGRFATRDLALLGDPELVYGNPDFEKYFNSPQAEDPHLSGAAAGNALYHHQGLKATELYRNLALRYPEEVEFLVGYGRALAETEMSDEFMRWHAHLPAASEERADIWNVRARCAQQNLQPETAVRCYWEAVRRDPNHLQANYQLAMLLHQLGDDDRANSFQQRAEKLKTLVFVFQAILTDDIRVEWLVKAAELTEALGRPWEAWGWYRAAVERSGGREDLRQRAVDLEESLSVATPQTWPQANPAEVFDLSNFPLPDWSKNSAAPVRIPTLQGSRWGHQVTFADMAPAAGVNFTYHNGDDPEVAGLQIFQNTGGGVAAFDFDGDAWADLYFTQGGEWPPRPGQTEYRDRLFHNLANGQFADVTSASGLGDERFSQGVASGDFNDDGFPDLYVLNIGKNRLYRNNGDGTFADCTTEAGLKSDDWSSSGLIADLNGDGFPEIYDVTYVAGREPFEWVCHHPRHKELVLTCGPERFAAEPDRLYLNRGDGTFEDVSARSGILGPDSRGLGGKGLGIVAAVFDGSTGLGLFVANDVTDNFLFVNRTERPGDVPAFVEQAKLSGCAVNAEGLPMASMGIAIGDADGDGLLDLFVTNFYDKSAVLYRQLPGGIFVDATSRAGLKEPTRTMLGFGTQFLDGDLDGRPDLVVANGHVDDYRIDGVPYRMRGQYFANVGEGRFAELPSEQLGDYFQRELLGRGMARLDWNRDGRDDFVVSNLDTPVSLVTNRTPETGHFLCLQLRGVQSSRDAIGATVVAAVGRRRLVRQLTAGDGYFASNQRQLILGLGEARVVDELLVRWPSGAEQRFASLSGDSEYVLVEGRSEPVRVPVPPSFGP